MNAYRCVIACVLVLAAAFAPACTLSTAPPRAHGASLSSGCQALNTRVFPPTNGFGSFFSFLAGETITIKGDVSPTGDSASTIALYVGTVQVDSAGFPGSLTYTFPADTSAYVFWEADRNNVSWSSSCTGGSAAPASAPAPGCDLGMPISNTSVVGQFVIDAAAYYVPEAKSDTFVISFPAGKTAWVLGVDSTGQFTQIVWSCSLLWVPVGAMSPAYGDALWQGRALPTGVVE